MKVKTSITLSEDLIQQIDNLSTGRQNRSQIIEKALRSYLNEILRKKRDAVDLEKINRLADQLNQEAEDVLRFQVEI